MTALGSSRHFRCAVICRECVGSAEVTFGTDKAIRTGEMPLLTPDAVAKLKTP